MERTNPLFEPTAAGVPASGRDGVDGDEDARRRARAGGTLVSAVERAKLLRERVVACYRTEGVNHLEKCKGHVKAYLASVKNVGTHAINAGEHDR